MTDRTPRPEEPDRPNRPEERVVDKLLRPARRFARSDGRFDLPVVTGRTPQEVARRLA
jgi:hypothetical protein